MPARASPSGFAAPYHFSISLVVSLSDIVQERVFMWSILYIRHLKGFNCFWNFQRETIILCDSIDRLWNNWNFHFTDFPRIHVLTRWNSFDFVHDNRLLFTGQLRHYFVNVLKFLNLRLRQVEVDCALTCDTWQNHSFFPLFDAFWSRFLRNE